MGLSTTSSCPEREYDQAQLIAHFYASPNALVVSSGVGAARRRALGATAQVDPTMVPGTARSSGHGRFEKTKNESAAGIRSIRRRCNLEVVQLSGVPKPQRRSASHLSFYEYSKRHI